MPKKGKDHEDLVSAFRLGACMAHMVHGGKEIEFTMLSKCRKLLNDVANGDLSTFGSPEDTIPLEVRGKDWGRDDLARIINKNRQTERDLASKILAQLEMA